MSLVKGYKLKYKPINKEFKYERTEQKNVSFFKERQHQHHFATEQDVAEEFFALLSKAREHYLQDVVTDGKRYDRYVDDFVKGHRYIDAIRRSAEIATK